MERNFSETVHSVVSVKMDTTLVYSFNMTCVKRMVELRNWLKLVLSAFLPLVLFFYFTIAIVMLFVFVLTPVIFLLFYPFQYWSKSF